MAKAFAAKILSFEAKGTPGIFPYADGWQRAWAVQPRPCINPGCEIPTRSEGGECAWCVVQRRAEVTSHDAA